MRPVLRATIVTTVMLGAICVGVAAVQADECVRFIRRAVPHHHKVSAETAARWAVWNKAHPNWHPKPAPRETLAKLDLACTVPLIQRQSGELLPSLEQPPIVFSMEMTAPPETPVIVTNTPVPAPVPLEEVAEGAVTPPIYAPQYPAIFASYVPPKNGKKPPPPPPPPPSAVPEPGSIGLLGTALAALSVVAWRRRLREAYVRG